MPPPDPTTSLWRTTDLALAVLSFLPLRSRLLLSGTCRLLHRLYTSAPPTAFDLSACPLPLVPPAVTHIATRVGPAAQRVNLHGYAGDIDGLLQRLCPACPNLSTISLQFCLELTDSGLRTIADHCPRLRTVSLWDCHRITEEGFWYLLDKCRALQVFDLRGLRQLTDTTMARIAALPGVSFLSLTGSGCTAAGFLHLLAAQRATLERIGCMCLEAGPPLPRQVLRGDRLVEVQVGYSAVEFHLDLRGLPNLRFLGISGNVQISVDWAELRFTKIEQLMADRCHFGTEFFEGIRTVAPAIKYLCVLDPYMWSYDSLVPAIRQMSNLRQLKVSNPPVQLLAALRQCPNLEFLWVERMQQTPERWEALRSFPAIKYLYLGVSGFQVGPPRPLQHTLTTMPALRALYLGDWSVDNRFLGHLAGHLPLLEVLDVSNGRLSAACGLHLIRMKRLRQLYLPDVLCADQQFSSLVIASLPLLQVFGPKLFAPDRHVVANSFSAWCLGCRRLPPKGYDERSGLKPPYSFVTACAFDQDTIYRVTEV
eukprot:EG_transcript_5958